MKFSKSKGEGTAMHADDEQLTSVYLPLRLTYGLVPVAAGLDKFFNLLADWQAYLPSFAASALPVSPETFMHVVGIIEVIAGLTILLGLTRLGAYVVMAWLASIAVVVALGGHFDIAVRDLVMAVGAYSLGQVAAKRGEKWIPGYLRTEGIKTHAPAA